jgi:MoxR-like ATPase
MSGRAYAVPDDVKRSANAVLRHRVVMAPELELEGASPDTVLDSILEKVPAPE